MKDFKRFLYSALAVIAIVFVVNQLLGTVLDNNAVFIDRVKHKRIANAKEELVVLGASRASDQYVTKLLEEKLGMKAFNYGLGGQNIYNSYVTLYLLLKTAPVKPKYVVWDFYYTDIVDVPGWNTEKVDVLYTAYNYDEKVKEVVNLQGGGQELLLRFIKLYKFNSKHPINKSYAKQLEKNGGYSSLKVEHSAPIVECDFERHIIDETKLKYINLLMDLCEENNIKLFVFVSPAYHIVEKSAEKDWSEVIEDICKKRSVPFFNYEQDSTFLAHPEWFYNPIHLNDKGAHIYTNIITDDIVNYLENSLLLEIN